MTAGRSPCWRSSSFGTLRLFLEHPRLRSACCWTYPRAATSTSPAFAGSYRQQSSMPSTAGCCKPWQQPQISATMASVRPWRKGPGPEASAYRRRLRQCVRRPHRCRLRGLSGTPLQQSCCWPQVPKRTLRRWSNVMRRNLRAVVRCLARGEDVNTWLRRGDGVQDTSGGTPLHACCAQHQLPGATAVVALLCNLRADVNAGDSEGDSPLAHARYFGAKEMEELLRAHGAQLRGPYYQYRLMRR